MKHFIIVGVLVVIVAAMVGVFLGSIDLLPVAASAESGPIDWLFGLHLQVISFLFALIMVFMIYSIVVFRRKPGDDSDGEHIHGNTKLEIVWTVIPLIIVLVFSFLGVANLQEITAPGNNELIVEVTGQQWSWRFDYPETGISTTDLYVPVGRKVRLKMTSTDVIHSFWVPEFRVKQDTVPGMWRDMLMTPTMEGVFKVRCAELCGTSHAYMLADVHVLSSSDYTDWENQEVMAIAAAENMSPAERGALVSELNGCLACHSVDGAALVGPTWKGTFGKEEALDDGSTVMVDNDYLYNSIIDPGAQVVEGYNNIMPAIYGDTLSDQDINDIIAYIESLAE